MLTPNLRSVFNELIRFETELWNAADAHLRAELELPLTWYEPMHVMALRDGCRVQDIADDLAITVGGASKLVDRIEAAGFCRRRPNPADRRSMIVELTLVGKDLLVRAQAVLEAELGRRMGVVLTGPALADFASTLAKLRAVGHSVDAARDLSCPCSS
ncbi:DNA-binding transcriptional repressor MarR [Mycobacteroides salmoniphilum]|uniref:DNA-binding transcriptional repressor MarR n=1 Tax=Mycobacteroides salmoniphilum TaxID=404941 RepID=A0A4R8RYG7_9MYCO|nr:MarR family winged helix-turn-helix transcriptional regulator [Mycobacteroides salmoniphilum]TDZ79606.1 DNA-binding transcriptional repressor MarR [Mycobacteroides salmoniphilum]TDZ81690.1 DNA-binding transcriptional repressor MarR [Mycobacteroides salmoniphilum]TDZ89190.1 DNA-binding transcriptional repressor MarR [Mycobacteroides salmoniphilum]